MMNIKVLCAIAAITLLAGCADRKDEDPVLREQEAMDAWMAAEHPEATRMDNGMWVEWLVRTDAQTATPVVGEDWVSVDYLVRDLEGNIIGTRDEQVARDEMTYTRVTHYVPDFAKLDPALRYFTPGEYAILPEMKVGDKARLYLPSHLAYTSARVTFINGYEGWFASSKNPANAASSTGVPIGGRPVVIDLELMGIVRDPAEVEFNEVQQLATDEDMTLITKGAYFKAVEENVEATVVPTDKTVWLTYALRFLDGKLVATNDDRVAHAEWDDYGLHYGMTLSFLGTGSSPIPGSAFNEAVKRGFVRYDSKMKLAFISDFGYGVAGAGSLGVSTKAAPRPVVFPYTPLVLEVTTMPDGYDPTATE
jgi:hypothetical protein